MIVVADSSPLNYLALIESIDLLRQLYGSVVVPQRLTGDAHPIQIALQVADAANYHPLQVADACEACGLLYLVGGPVASSLAVSVTFTLVSRTSAGPSSESLIRGD